MEHFDDIVIGAGAMGSAAAYHLAKDRRRVLLLEQFEIGHIQGSSHGESRIFRFAYQRLEYARLAIQCKPLWKALEAEAGKRLLLETGGLDLADDETGFAELDAVAQALDLAGGAYERLDRPALAARYPQWQLGADAVGLRSPDSGILFATDCVRTMVDRAADHGATVRDREPVAHLQSDGHSADVRTTRDHYRASKVIVTAGAWMNQLLGHVDLGLPLQVEREQVAYFEPRSPAAFAPDRFPIWIHYRRPVTSYGFPTLSSRVKAGLHHTGVLIDVDDYRQEPDQEVLGRLSRYIAQYLPDLDPSPRDALTCLYTNTPDHNFVVDVVPHLPNVLIASPCSGHGFKFAIGIGRALADLAQHGATPITIDFLRTLQR